MKKILQKNLEGVDLSGAHIINTNFVLANLVDADISNAQGRSANFGSANLSGADLSGAQLRAANFERADLSNADFSDSLISDASTTDSVNFHTLFERCIGIPIGTPVEGELPICEEEEDTERPVIALNGENIVTLKLGIDSYVEQGATVSDNNLAYMGIVTIGGDTVDVNVIGTYVVEYNANPDPSGNVPIQVNRIVNVDQEESVEPVIPRCAGTGPLTLQTRFGPSPPPCSPPIPDMHQDRNDDDISSDDELYEYIHDGSVDDLSQVITLDCNDLTYLNKIGNFNAVLECIKDDNNVIIDNKVDYKINQVIALLGLERFDDATNQIDKIVLQYDNDKKIESSYATYFKNQNNE